MSNFLMPVTIFTVAILLNLLSACGDMHSSSQPITSKQADIEVTDFAGNTVTLSAPAKRIIALAPHVVENIFSAGAGDALVAVVEHSDFPEQAASLPSVGGYEKVNHERIIDLNPDLIIAWQSGNSHAHVSRLRELGYTVYLDQPDTLVDVAKSILDIGVLSGRTEIATTVAQDYLTKLNALEKQYENAMLIPTFYQVWNEPLRTINGSHIISDAIELCGGVNIFADEFAVAPIINIESILERDPLAIIASGMSEARPSWLDDWRAWPTLTAVQKNNLLFVNPDHIQRHTVRLLSGIESICTQFDQVRQK